MATQIGFLRISGTVDGLCFYRMGGVYYARKQSSLSTDRVKKDPVFAETRWHAKRMGKASRIASLIYRHTVPKEERSRQKYQKIVGMVIRELAIDDHVTQDKIIPTRGINRHE